MNAPLAGRLRLHPGATRPIAGGRPDAARLALGRRGDELPALLAALFTLCAHAHRLTARRAVAAARGDDDSATRADLQAMRLATARDQVMRLARDLPLRLGPVDAVQALADGLASCPLWRGETPDAQRLAALPQWLAGAWLGMPLEVWRARLDDDGLAWVGRWCRHLDTPAAAWWRHLQPLASGLPVAARPWRVLDDAHCGLRALAQRFAQGRSAFVDAAATPETGPWTRHHDAHRETADNAWMRLVSRLADLARLAAPDGDRWLAHGATNTGRGEGLAWTEMARGLLVHWVALDEAGRVRGVRVLAPTDVNFDPHGVLAQALSALPANGALVRSRVLAAAFDPCVDFDVVAGAGQAVETAHA